MSKLKNYKTSIMIGEQKIIPSDVFESDTSKYVLMDIIVKEGKTILEIMALSGPYISQTFFIDQDTFSTLSLKDFETFLLTYKQE